MEIVRIEERNDLLIPAQNAAEFVANAVRVGKQTVYCPQGIVIIGELNTRKTVAVRAIFKEGMANTGRMVIAYTDATGKTTECVACDAIRVRFHTVQGTKFARVEAVRFGQKNEVIDNFVADQLMLADTIPGNGSNDFKNDQEE